ncbi:MAG: hypothetical protein AB8I80_03380 [Anaerolineae bacterium]
MNQFLPPTGRWTSFHRAAIVTKREVRDTLRDWRLVVPILLLTLVFPLIMQFTASMAQRWVVRYGGELIGQRSKTIVSFCVRLEQPLQRTDPLRIV